MNNPGNQRHVQIAGKHQRNAGVLGVRGKFSLVSFAIGAESEFLFIDVADFNLDDLFNSRRQLEIQAGLGRPHIFAKTLHHSHFIHIHSVKHGYTQKQNYGQNDHNRTARESDVFQFVCKFIQLRQIGATFALLLFF